MAPASRGKASPHAAEDCSCASVIDANLIPCRACHARPGMACNVLMFQRGGTCATRESDAALVAELMVDRKARPSVIRKPTV